jgi:geranylgeranyl pyrophosphate synthase
MPRKIGKILVAEFTKRSKKGLEFAKQTLQAETIYDPKVHEALCYYLANWENFSQPGLFSAACEAVGGNPDSVIPVQASIAMMVAAFDIQDDIIDKSKEKHNKPTTYGKFGPEIAILLGNAFLLEGLKMFADSAALLPDGKGKEALEILKNLLFEVGNAHGLELGFRESKSTNLNDYLRIFEMKSASIEADICLGALFGGAGEVEIKVAAKLGRILGKLIMLREEFVDIFEIEELTQRIAIQDLPLPIIAAMQEEDTKRMVLKILSKPNKTDNDVRALLKVTLKSKPVIEIKNNMQLLMGEGISLLNKLPSEKLQGTLQSLLSFMLEDL